MSAPSSDAYAFAERLDSDPSLDLEFVRARLADSRVEAGAVVLGAFDPGLVGMLGLHRINGRTDAARFWGFYVHPARRCGGCGRALVVRALHCAGEMTGVVRVELSVSEEAVPAIHLYEHAGFESAGTADGSDA